MSGHRSGCLGITPAALASGSRPARAARLALAALAALTLAACSETGGPADLSLAGDPNKAGEEKAGETGKPPLSALDQAARDYAKNPGDADATLAYVDKLKENDRKADAMTVLQQATEKNTGDRRLTSAYGRLALDLGKISLAKGLLEAADDPSNPDWRVVSARGTALAMEGRHSESIAFYERARPLSKDHSSVINNLALAYMMSGEPAKAEPLLRQATLDDPKNVKVRQNLALVLSLQGKYEDAKALAVLDMPPEAAAANADLLRRMTHKEGRPATATATTSRPAAPDNEPDAAPVRATPAAAPAGPTPAKRPPGSLTRGSLIETSSTSLY